MTTRALRKTPATKARKSSTPDLIGLLDRIGGLVTEDEVRRQCERRGWDAEQSMLALYELRAEGKVEVHYSLTKAGRS